MEIIPYSGMKFPLRRDFYCTNYTGKQKKIFFCRLHVNRFLCTGYLIQKYQALKI